MELWIRSQDRESLTKVSNVQYTYQKGDLYTDVRGKHHIGTYYDNLKILGTYATKERALEVLDEIEKILKPQVITKLGKIVGKTCDGTIYTTPNETEIKELSTYVYQMPKD